MEKAVARIIRKAKEWYEKPQKLKEDVCVTLKIINKAFKETESYRFSSGSCY